MKTRDEEISDGLIHTNVTHCQAMHLPGINRQKGHTPHSNNSSCGVRNQKALVYKAIIKSILIILHEIETKFTASDVWEVDTRNRYLFVCLLRGKQNN